MATKEIPVNIYAESTPNPSTMKFVANKLLLDNGETVEYTTPEEADASPLAARLFNFPFVTGIFMASNFITISKNELVDWPDITLDIREFITDHIKSGKAIFKEQPVSSPSQKENNSSGKSGFQEVEPDTELETQIVQVLEEYVRPAVEQDGGAIHFRSFDETSGVLTVTLRGACSGCPSSMITLKNGIESLFHRMLPEVKEVVAEEG